jgi:hypothetical protein
METELSYLFIPGMKYSNVVAPDNEGNGHENQACVLILASCGQGLINSTVHQV